MNCLVERGTEGGRWSQCKPRQEMIVLQTEVEDGDART